MRILPLPISPKRRGDFEADFELINVNLSASKTSGECGDLHWALN
jgi:hypothetical protein